GERCNVRTLHEPLVCQVFPQELDSVLSYNLPLSIALDDRFWSAAARDHYRFGAEERITGHALATFDRFKQKGVRRITGDPHECPQRRLQIRKDRTSDRDDVAARRVALELLKSRWRYVDH